jgi:hypothetical protein
VIPIPGLLTNKYIWAAAAGALVVWSLFTYHTIKVHQAESKGYEQGMKDERIVWQVRENHELTAKNALINELQTKYRELEKKSAEDVALAATQHQKEKANVERKLQKALADARAGTAFRLRWAASCAPTRKDPGGSASAAPGADSAAPVGTATCELPDRTREDLIRLASRADVIALERNVLLEIAKKDREVCR